MVNAYENLKIWKTLSKIKWTPKEWEVVEWSLGHLDSLLGAEDFLEDNPGYAENEEMQWEDFYDDLERYIDMSDYESKQLGRSAKTIISNIRKKLQAVRNE